MDILFLADNLLKSLDWDRIVENGFINRIQWKFNPPTASWWGGSLVQRQKSKGSTISVGDVVLIGKDNQKRINWPLGRVIQIIPGKEKISRLVRLRTAHGEMLRPIQRVFLLEITCQMAEEVEVKVQREQAVPVADESLTRMISPADPVSHTVRTQNLQ
ncbi:DUF5641 domain-containing protein [Nephila pilipes]|uniref:DUF5641 domain-containing protein n=1 Tax=Nephila pilipes TaxID=299642 RepID=A0A8X6NGZ8_NEPPI|nr:DUF5641 domain-containing protein [Nephila pilipes]